MVKNVSLYVHPRCQYVNMYVLPVVCEVASRPVFPAVAAPSQSWSVSVVVSKNAALPAAHPSQITCS